ncbi:MAG: hydrogenase formation protein HypD [Nitrospirae bacterium]|nr:hydrogenase formation protein HypD [Nitrospirota bacterium]
MDYISEFRDSAAIKLLVREIGKYSDIPLKVMEICGGHTHTIMKYGINQILPPNIEFIHGPGCPVCIMPKERIDHAIVLARQKDVILATLGDMMRVPGSESSLIKERADGIDVRPLYSPNDVLNIARDNPDKKVVYFAIGFETTTSMTAFLIDAAVKQGLKNILFHINHVIVPPPIEAIMDSANVRIKSFIGPGHVSAITGIGIYKPIVEKYKTPVVICGFEPVDILQGILMLMRQFNEGRREVEVQYRRAVRPEGNPKAISLIEKYMDIRDSFRWRGLGDIPKSGLKLRDEFKHLDAEEVYRDVLPDKPIDDHKVCRCGDILKGIARPYDCRVFGGYCTPETPIGACMVSSEGACHAYYKYRRDDG